MKERRMYLIHQKLMAHYTHKKFSIAYFRFNLIEISNGYYLCICLIYSHLAIQGFG